MNDNNLLNPTHAFAGNKPGDFDGDRINSMNIVPYQLSVIKLHELVAGQIIDKRRAAIDFERMGRALVLHNTALGEAILETGAYTVIMSTVTLTQAKEFEGNIYQAGGAPLNMGHMGLQQPLRAGGYMGPQQLQFAVFSDLTQPGVQISLHPQLLQQYAGGMGEGAAINLVLGLLLGESQDVGLGFGK